MRKIILILATVLSLCTANKTMAQVVASGTTGDCTWMLTGTAGNYTLTISGNGAMDDYDMGTTPWSSYIEELKTLNIQQGVTLIGNHAFSNCDGFFGTLTIPNSVTSIGDYAFYACDGFRGSLTIPNSVTSIGSSAFYACDGFTGTLTISNSVMAIEPYAFYDCIGFTGTLTIPNTVTTIGDHAFANCRGFIGSLIIPNSVTSIGDSAFYYCIGFTGTLAISNTVTTIGDHAFFNCRRFIGALIIPNSVTSIGDYAFYYCIGLTSVTFGNSVDTIGDYAFSSCSRLTEMYVKTINPPRIFEITFDDVSKSIPVYVCGSVEDYRKSAYWSRFTNIIKDNNCNTGIETFSLAHGISVYPNPATDHISVILPENVSNAVFTLYDMQGKVLIQQNIGNQDVVSVNNLAAGIYIYSVITNKQKHIGKIIINK
jgi:hypothetical protein